MNRGQVGVLVVVVVMSALFLGTFWFAPFDVTTGADHLRCGAAILELLTDETHLRCSQAATGRALAGFFAGLIIAVGGLVAAWMFKD